MTLAPGVRLGAYEILSPLGAGGMGAVYRARDTKLQRDVAIKILHALDDADPEQLARFDKEARLLAALNHPHIAAIYGVEDSSALRALVLELVDGPTLAERIAVGPIPWRDALSIARQIAEALDAAHNRAIVHRDLKPANVKVTAEGTIKVLDFGLAKALDPRSAGVAADPFASPTLTAGGTQPGVILGTAAYMAPEQACGKPVDQRADIWAFGVVLFEMLAGKRPFDGDQSAEILAKIIEREPDWPLLPSDTPPGLRRVLSRCLTKDPRRRLRDIGDVVLDLDEAASGSVLPDPIGVPNRRRQTQPWVVATVASIVAALALIAAWRDRPVAAGPVMRFSVAVPARSGTLNPVLSADGRLMVYSTDRLYVHRFDRGESQPLAGTENAAGQFISRDARWIGFFADGKIKKIAVDGGDALTICDASADLPGAAWGPNNTILFTPAWSGGLATVSADGGTPQPLTTPDKTRNEKGHWWPHVLPDGRHVLFTIWLAGSGVNDTTVAVLDLDTRAYRVLFPGAMARYASGHVIYYRAPGYYAVPVDERTLRVTGEPVALFGEARPLDAEGTTLKPLSVSDNGMAAYVPGTAGHPVVFDWMDRDGRRTPSGSTARRFIDADLSPDQRRLAVSEISGGTYTLTIHDLERKTQESVTGQGSNWTGRWAPDNQRIAVTSLRKGEFDIYLGTDTGALRPLLVSDHDESPLGWSPDGRLLCKEWLPDGTIQLGALNTADSTKTVLASGRFQSLDGARVAPGGRWLSVISNPSGQTALYVLPFRGSGRFTRVSSAGVGGGWLTNPWVPRALWSAAGRELFYRRGEELIAVKYREVEGEFVVEEERTLFRLPAFELIGISRDATRFLVAVAAAPPPSRDIDVVLNWPSQLTHH